jgi:phage-related protein (TIGR01555 family)
MGMSKRSGSRRRIDNSLTELVAAVRVGSLGTGGSALSSYGTIGHSNNYSLITLNRIILTYLYTGNGIFQTAIQLPVQDAISKGIELDSDEMDNSDIDEVMDFWEEKGVWETILQAFSWARLYGGGAIVVNTNQDPETPMNPRGLQNSPIEFYDADRWQLDTGLVYGGSTGVDSEQMIDADGYIYLQGQRIHASRAFIMRGKKAPSYVRRNLRGWGMSEGERMIRDLNNYLKTQDVLYEILDESKIDVYKIAGLANKLLTAGGTGTITRRIQAANEVKNYVNALVLDAEEDYQQKQIAFAGLSEVMRENRVGVASALRMPVTKLFGLSAAGFNTGETDLESYNQMVESEVRAKLRPVIRNLLSVTMAHLFGRIPTFRFSWPTLRVLSAMDEQNVKSAETSRALMLYDRGLIDSQETAQILAKAGVLDIETKAEQGLLPPQPPAPNNGENIKEPGAAAVPTRKSPSHCGDDGCCNYLSATGNR